MAYLLIFNIFFYFFLVFNLSLIIKGMIMSFAVFGAGCFWCIEAIFSQVDGVSEVISGYTGGHLENPTYEQICKGQTGHAEVCKVIYDSEKVSFDDLLKIFWKNHDPTTLNQQGADIGTQYRSVIFYNNDNQKNKSAHYKNILEQEKVFNDPIVTEIVELEKFYEAENYHQEYYKNNPGQPYCLFVIKPKLDKFFKNYKKNDN